MTIASFKKNLKNGTDKWAWSWGETKKELLNPLIFLIESGLREIRISEIDAILFSL
jgi:hypothetical protein